MKWNRRKCLATIGTTVSALALAGCLEEGDSDSDSGDVNDNGGNSNGGDSDNGDNGDSGNGGSDQPDIELLEHEFYQEDFTEGVRGTAVNNTDSELGYVEANAVFLDESGTQIADGIDNVTDLAAGREWEFECLFLGSDASRIDRYEIEVSSGF